MAQSRLIEDLLDTAGIITGNLRLEIGPVDLVWMIEEAVQTIRPAADAKGISLQAEFPPEVGQITGDPSACGKESGTWSLTRSSSRHKAVASKCAWSD